MNRSCPGKRHKRDSTCYTGRIPPKIQSGERPSFDRICERWDRCSLVRDILALVIWPAFLAMAPPDLQAPNARWQFSIFLASIRALHPLRCFILHRGPQKDHNGERLTLFFCVGSCGITHRGLYPGQETYLSDFVPNSMTYL